MVDPTERRPIVLVHGAWHGAWCFEPVIELLESGHHVVAAVDLPLEGPTRDVEAARECIAQHPGAVVLGHSYGGFVISQAALGLDVSHLVYLAAFMPDTGENVGASAAKAPRTVLNDAMVVQDDGLVSIEPTLAIDAFYHDCDQAAAEAAVSRLRPQRFESYPILEGAPPWRSVPSTYVVCRDDRALAPALQRKFAGRAGSVVEWEGAHSPFLAQPERVAELLMNLAEIGSDS